jgi:hypothetical protein
VDTVMLDVCGEVHRPNWRIDASRFHCHARIPAGKGFEPERAGVPRSAAMAMVGHKTEAIYRRYAIVDAESLRAAAMKLDIAAGTIAGPMADPATTGARQSA